MLFVSVFVISFSALAFEVLLTRIFSITQWHHLTFMVISMALFGFAASGICLGVMESRKRGWMSRWVTPAGLGKLCLGYTFSAIITVFTLGHFPLDYFRLPIEPVQVFFLMIAYLLPATPFFIAGLIIALAYAHQPQQSGRIYFANMSGSALGAVSPWLILPFLREERLLVLSALIPLVIIFFNSGSSSDGKGAKGDIKPASKRQPPGVRARVLMAGVGLFFVTVAFSPWTTTVFSIRPTSYKDLSRIRQWPDTRIVDSISSIRGRIDKVKSPFLRFAPGLSLKWTEPISARLALFNDGDGRMVLFEPNLETARRWAPYTLSWAGYLLAHRPQRILLLIQNGGTSLACAAAANPTDLTIVIAHPGMAKIVANYYHYPVISAPPVVFLSRSNKQFDLIQVENRGSSMIGTAAMVQDHSFTIQQIDRYLNHLTPDGVLIFTRRLRLPPADMIRLWATAYESLHRRGVALPADHLAVLRSWDMFTLIVSIRPLSHTNVLKKFAHNRNFDMVYMPQLDPADANRYNVFDTPVYYLEIDRLAADFINGNTAGDYFKAYLLDAAPQSDRRPFPNRFIKWHRLPEIYRATGSRFYTLFLSGEIIVVAVLMEAILISLFLLAVPAITGQRSNRLTWAKNGYFLSVGAGFIFSEIYFIKTYTYIFGDPLISFTFVLTGLLIFSGMGGFYSRYFSARRLVPGLMVLVGLMTGLFLFHDQMVAYLLCLPSSLRFIIALVHLLPIGFLMGLGFPIGMRDLLDSPAQRTWAWAINGCASVVAAVASAQFALTTGIPTLMLIAVTAYTITLICLVKAIPK